MANPNRIDRNALHRILYRRADRHKRITLDMRALCSELDVEYTNFTRIIKGFREEGRLRQIGGPSNGNRVYIVEDPDHWETPETP